MFRNHFAFAALAALVACGDGNPFGGIGGGDGEEVVASENFIPEDIAGEVTGFTYDPGAGTMTLTGTLRDGDEQTTTFTRAPVLDRGVYQAYTAQDDPLDEHTTVYVREVGTSIGAVALTGGQFTYYSAGVSYDRTSAAYTQVPESEFNDSGLVTYAGQYIGMSNIAGPGSDLLPVPVGIDPSIIPDQASVITGSIFINVGFADDSVSGAIYDRQIELAGIPGPVTLNDLFLQPGSLEEDGTFRGDVQISTSNGDLGDYGGIIAGIEAESVSGGIYAEDHMTQAFDSFGNEIDISDEEELGLFVLGRCNGPLEDASLECDTVD